MSLIARMIIPISVIVTLATSFIGWKAYSDARDSVAEATRILEISTLDAVGRELTTVMNLPRQHLLTVADRIAIIEGVPKLVGCPVTATDLRAGAALVIAGLMAEGVTDIYNVHFIDRGYEHLEDKLRSLGAQIERLPAEED